MNGKELQTQILFNKNYLEKLLEKLTVGNGRSIHLNAVAGKLKTRLDITDLALSCQGGYLEKDNLSSNFIKTLLSKSKFKFAISNGDITSGISALPKEEQQNLKEKGATVAKRLDSITIENEDKFLETGIKNFGFGYPLLVKKDRKSQGKVIVSPVFIWSLDIQKSNTKNEWIITKTEDNAIKVNEMLISHIKQDEGIDIQKLSDELDDDILQENEVLAYLNTLLKTLDVGEKVDKIDLVKCPLTKETVEKQANGKPFILWSGIFGLYSSQKDSIIENIKELMDNAELFNEKSLKIEPFQNETVVSIDIDPSKSQIIDTLNEDEFKIIQGPPGTGKSQAISAIIANALSNGAKTLVVCEKKTALDVLVNNLIKEKLDTYSIVIDDVIKDRKLVVEKARDICELNQASVRSFDKESFYDTYDKYLQLKDEINNSYKEASRPIFGGKNWKQLIGLYLKYSRTPNSKQAIDEFKNVEFRFSETELTAYTNAIIEGKILYGEVKDIDKSTFDLINFNDYGDRITTKENIDLSNKIADALAKLKQMQEYTKSSDFRFGNLSISSSIEDIQRQINKTNEVISAADELCEKYKVGMELEGDKFDKKEIGFLGSFFSAKTSQAHSLIKFIKEAYGNIVHSGILGEKCKSWDDYVKIGDLVRDLQDKRPAFTSCIAQCRTIIECIGKIKETNDFVGSNFSSADDLRAASGDISRYSEALEKKINQLDFLRNNLDKVESCNRWYKFKNGNKEVVEILLKHPAEQWEQLFLVAYYYYLLLDFCSKSKCGFNKNETSLRLLGQLYQQLQNEMAKKITYYWHRRRQIAINAYEEKYGFNSVFSLRKNQKFGKRLTLKQIIKLDFENFTSMFPVVMVNPIVANTILPLEQGIFDLVIFDEASQLRIEDTYTSIIRGKYKIIAGDKHQMPPSNYFASNVEYSSDDELDLREELQLYSESLLSFAESLKYKNMSYLDFHYRSKHPALINFSNCAFYGGNLIPLPAMQEYTPIIVKEVGGIYKDGGGAAQINTKEAEEVIQVLSSIEADKNGVMPSVGIATFNIHQRNCIKEMLYKTAYENEQFSKKLEKLQESGLFVKNLENIQGDERDIIIISTTFGQDGDGKFYQKFGSILTDNGYKLLNVLITRAKKQLFLVTSIPQNYYSKWQMMLDEKKENNKAGLLYAYISYAKAISNRDIQAAENILKTLQQYSYDKARSNRNEATGGDELTENCFEEEIYNELVKVVEPANIHAQYKVGGYRLDFMVETNGKKVAIECDGKSYHQSEQAYAEDKQRQEWIEKFGYSFYRIWSTNWFENKDREVEKLRDFLGRI